MTSMDSTIHGSDSRSTRSEVHQPHRRDAELKDRRRREWMKQQEREREHELLKRKKIEEWEKKRRAEETKSDRGRSSYQSSSRSADRSSSSCRRDDPQPKITKSCVTLQKFEPPRNNMQLFKGPEGTKIDMTELRRIKVDIHRNIPAAAISTELQREILNPEDVKLKRREGEGAKPIFEREELRKSDVPTPEIEEHRTVVVVDNERTEKSSPSTRIRSTSPTNSHKQRSHNSRCDSDGRSLRRDNSKQNDERSEGHRSQKHDSEKGGSRDRHKEHRERHKREDTREHHSPRRTSSHDLSRDHRHRRNRSSSRNREPRGMETRRRLSRDRVPYREKRDRDDSRDRRSRGNRSRERKIPLPHHYAATMPIPLYYQGFHPRPIMVGPMMPIRGQMPMGRGRMPSMMGPMRSPFPLRFMPPEMYRSALNPNQRFGRMF